MAVIDEVRAEIAEMNAAIANGDAGAIAALYAADARFLPDGALRIDGQPGIEGFFRQAAEAGFNDLHLETQEVLEMDDRVVEIGRATRIGAPEEAGGKYVIVWRRHAGRLRIEVDIFNSDSSLREP